MIPALLIYIFLSYLVAFFGRNRKFGFWTYFVLCFIFTPLLTFVIVLGSDKRVTVTKATAEEPAPVATPDPAL
jgi:Na+/melibiose symporter-like transporter